MRLAKVISGGQTGADVTALICAKALGLQTGGTAPKGWKIDGGTNPKLAEYGLVESNSTDYAIRTKLNVRDADVTIWIGKTNSPGYWCTHNAAKTNSKPFFVNPTELQLEYICNSYETVNFAGNRARIYPEVEALVCNTFRNIAKILGKDVPNF